ncbi:hypothetical protein BHE74_00049529 [Ensete ventricosum]|nr:hypothetical protein BHE74_00049529 [Ensete ventricosum]
MSDLSSLLLGGAGGCPRGCSARGHFDSSRLPATSISTVMYWCAHCIISGNVAGGHSIMTPFAEMSSGEPVVELPIGLYSKGYEASVPKILTAPVAYHAVVLRRSLRGPCDEARGVLAATGNVGLAPLTPIRSAVRRLTLSCLCQAGSNHVGSATSLGQLSGGTGTWQLDQHPSYQKT